MSFGIAVRAFVLDGDLVLAAGKAFFGTARAGRIDVGLLTFHAYR